MAGGAFVDLNVSDSDELRIDKINQNMRALLRRGGGTSTLVVQQPLLSQGPVYAGGPDMGGGYMKEDSAYQEFPTFPAMQEALRAAVREAVLAAHPVGSYYISESDANPGELIGGSWEKLEGYFLRAGSGTGTGGSDSKTLAVGNLPSHSHGMDHTHTVKHGHWMQHNHDMSWHTHSVPDHSHRMQFSTGESGTHYHTPDWGENYQFASVHKSVFAKYKVSTSSGSNAYCPGAPNSSGNIRYSYAASAGNHTHWIDNWTWGSGALTSGGPSNNTTGNSVDWTGESTPTTSGSSSTSTGSTGSGQAFDVKPRYKDVHVWRRVA